MIGAMQGGACSACGLALAGLLTLELASNGGCTGHEAQPDDVGPHEPVGPAAQPSSQAAAVELVRIKTRDHVIVMHAGDGSSRTFTITAADGSLLADRLDEGAVARQFPELHGQIQSMMASWDCAGRGDCPVLDASLGTDPLGDMPDGVDRTPDR